MKTKIAALVLALCFLTGCAGQSGEYYSSVSHEERGSTSLASPNSDNISGYYSLKGALLNLVSMGISEDVLRIVSYGGDLEDDLKVAIQEITTAEPLGIYGVSAITATQKKVLTYRELSVSIEYKRSPEEMREIITISGEYDFENRVADLYSEHGTRGVYYLKGGAGNSTDINKQLYHTWMQCGKAAVGLDKSVITVYPEDSEVCIIEIENEYAFSAERLQSLTDDIEAAAQGACEGLGDAAITDKLERIAGYLFTHVTYDYSLQKTINDTNGTQAKTNRYTAYGALVQGEAAQPGYVLAASVMCKLLDIEHTVETGTYGGDVYSWIEIATNTNTYVFDVTARQNGRETMLYTAKEAEGSFISW